MSVNRQRPHLFILPEDDANRQMAVGFVLGMVNVAQVRILAEVGGWLHVCEKFVKEHVKGMRQYPERFMILLVDFDNDATRLQKIQERIPPDLKERVFVVGVQPEPETLKQHGCGSYETMGRKLAEDCLEAAKMENFWKHECLRHNEVELTRLRQSVCDLLL